MKSLVSPRFNVVLVEPEIPQNTGNIGRLCLATGSTLHLIEPLGFSIDEKALRRAGLDYWKHLQVQRYPSIDIFLKEVVRENPVAFFTTKAKKCLFESQLRPESYLFFGKETAGLSVDLLKKYEESCLKVPLFDERVRSLNLANTVGIVLYEGIRQNLFV